MVGVAGFSPQQRETAQDLTEAPSFARAGPIARQALLEAGIVESTLRDQPHEGGNLDSEGVLQQRASQGWGTVAQERNPVQAAEMFLRHAIPLEHQYRDAGSLAQAVQRSAFPGRYGEHAGEAQQLLKGVVSGPRARSASSSTPGTPTAATTTTGPSAVTQQALQSVLAEVKAMSGPGIVAASAQPARPAFSAGPTMPEGARPIQPLTPKPAQNPLLPLIERAITAAGAPNVESKVEGGNASGAKGPEYAPAHTQGGPLGGLLPAHAMLKIGRIDEGQDGQTNPGGAIIANGNGKVVDVKSDPGGFGPSYPLVVFSSGPLAGLGPIYFGHTLSARKVGDTVRAGDVISHTGTKGVGNATVPGWFEIGLGNTIGQGNQGQGARIAPHLR